MNHSHSNDQACMHCACNNPVMSLLEETLFSIENMEKATALFKPAPAQQNPEPVMFSGGTIRPLINGDCSPVEAIAFAEGKVVAVGTTTDVQGFMQTKYPGYTSNTLSQGQVLLPGLLEAHTHIVPSALMQEWVDVSPFSVQNLNAAYNLAWVKQQVNDNLPTDGSVLLGCGLDPALLNWVNAPTTYQPMNNTILDEYVNNTIPIMLLSASGHTLYLNTLAYKYVLDHNPILFAKYLGSYEKYIEATNGQLEEAVQMKPALDTVSIKIAEMLLSVGAQLDAMFQQANSRGVTFMYDALMTDKYYGILKKYMDGGSRPMRVGAAHYCTSQVDADLLGQYSQPDKYEDIYFGHVKVVSDGSNQGLTGYQSTPYSCAPPNNYGVFDIPPTTGYMANIPSEYQDLVNEVIDKKGWPMMIHANGDQAVKFAIGAYQTAIQNYKGDALRHRIEHCSLLDAGDVQTMNTLGISPSFLIGHVGYWGFPFQNVIFANTNKPLTLDLCNTALQNSLRISLHSDHMVTPLGPLRMMEQSITRVMEADTSATNNILNPAECLTAEQALIAVTYDAAWQCYADNWVGSLNTGYFADFIILATDPLTMPAADISMNMRNIEVVQTWVGGNMVYQSGN